MLWDTLRDATYTASLGCYIELDGFHMVPFEFSPEHFEVFQTQWTSRAPGPAGAGF